MKAIVLKYKGYSTRIEFNPNDKVFHGKIEGIKDLITFESDNTAGIESSFQEAVDDYLSFCCEVGKTPEGIIKF